MRRDLWRQYSKDNRHFANVQFVGELREFMIEFRENERLRRMNTKKSKNKSVNTK